MERNGERYNNNNNKDTKKPKPLLCRAWSENCQEVDIPGTPKTPRTSTTPGRKKTFKILLEKRKIYKLQC